MPQDNAGSNDEELGRSRSIENLPPNFRRYLEGSGEGHLKVLGTIPNAERPDEIDWAIFGSVKKARPGGDPDFHGTVDGLPGAPQWRGGRPLWLIPISVEAVGVAEKAEDGKVPPIHARHITVRNPGLRRDGEMRWLFWYEDDTQWQADPKLLLGSALSGLSAKGHWRTLQAAGDADALRVWYTEADLNTEDQVIVFPCPCNHVFSTDKKQADQFHAWFGVRENKKPFIAVARLDQPEAGGDCPLVWRRRLGMGDGRLDDVLIPRVGATVQAIGWRSEWPVKEAQGGLIPNRITRKFGANAFAWLLRETMPPQEGGVAQTYFYPIYARAFEAPANTSLRQALGEVDIHVVQVCRQETSLLARLEDVSQQRAIARWNTHVQSIEASLTTIAGAAPVGIVPVLEGVDDGDLEDYVAEWTTGTSVPTGTCCGGGADGYNLVAAGFPKEDGVAGMGTVHCGSVRLPAMRHDKPDNLLGKAPILLSRVTLAGTNGASNVSDNGTIFQLLLSGFTVNRLAGDAAPVLRDGAMAFTIGAQVPASLPLKTDTLLGRLRLTLQLAQGQRPFFPWQWHPALELVDRVVMGYAVEDLSLPVLFVKPAGQDALATDKLLAPRSINAAGEGAGERAEPALVIPVPAERHADSGGVSKFFLTASESVNVGQSHRFDLRLQEISATPGSSGGSSIKAVVLDSNPQLTALVDCRFLQQPGIDDGAWVLARRSPLSEEDGGWELLDDEAATLGFRLVLPAQAIGEAYVKGRTQPGEPVLNQPIEFRFGAPAILRLAQERLERRYVAVPWNLRRIWGRAGDEAPGTPLLEARFELLYGLTAHLVPSKAFLVELGAKLGEVPTPPVNSIAWNATEPQKNVFEDQWRNYREVYRAWQSRLAVLELSRDDAFSNASFAEGLSYAPRIIVEATPPNDQGIVTYRKDKGADLRWPIESVPPEMPPPGEVELPVGASQKDILLARMAAAHATEGLAGGFHYGFESFAIYTEFWREAFSRGSSSAEAHGLAFSSPGGWGRQSARFAADKTIIKSNTSLGRTHFYAVERIGRIGVYWNKAKHVIEYERTVVPSKQFAGAQEEHPGRPLVRKVREYVEILEPTRAYPDFPMDDDPAAPGAVMACTFKSKIIPVLSTWGKDVWDIPKGEFPIGWEVPLWKRGADPEIYPKPQVMLDLAPPPDSDEKAIRVSLSEPDNLWFYTDTRETVVDAEGKVIQITADVHAWPPIVEVDYTRLPDPRQEDIKPAAGDSPALLDAPMPAATSVPPGFERYTFRVDRVELPAAVASRYFPDSAITGRLRTVTMSRSVADAEKVNVWWSQPGAARASLQSLARGAAAPLAVAANGFAELESRFRSGSLAIADYENAVFSKVTSVAGSVRNAVAGIVPPADQSSVSKPTLKHFDFLWASGENFAYPTRWLWREALTAADGLVNQTLGFYDQQTGSILKEIDRLIAAGNNETLELEAALLRFEERVVAFRLGIEFSVDGAFSAVQKALDHVRGQAESAIDSAFTQFDQWVENRAPELQLADAKTRLTQLNDRLFFTAGNPDAVPQGQTGAAIHTLIENLKPLGDNTWDGKMDAIDRAIQNRIRQFHSEIAAAIQMADNTTGGFIQRMRREINARSMGLRQDLRTQLETIHTEASSLLADARNAYHEISTALTMLWDTVWADIKIRLAALRAAVQTSTAGVRDIVATGLAEVRTALKGQLVGALTQVLVPPSLPGINITVFEVLTVLNGLLLELRNLIISSLLDFIRDTGLDVTQWLETLNAYQRLQDAIRTGDLDAILQESTALGESINEELGRFAGEVAQKVRDADAAASSAGEVIQAGKETLRNIRSVWEEFTAPGLGLNRRTVAMIVNTDFKDVQQRLSLTPCISRVKQFGKDLEGLGLRLPVVALANRLLPPMPDWKNVGQSLLDNFGFGNLMSDIGGMRLDKLFPGFKMPQFARDKIKITQGFDKQTLMAWVNAEADVTLAGKKAIMNFGPLRVDLENGIFQGHLRLEMGIDGQVKKTNTGTLTGSWHMGLSGSSLMIFRDTKIIYRDGRVSVDLDPNRMEMPGLMKILTDATKNLSGLSGGAGEGEDEVFKVGLVKVGAGIPAGIRATLDIPPISVGGGVAALTNLSFGGFFEMTVLRPNLTFSFRVGVGFYVGKKLAPFNLTVFILGGGGHVDGAIYYEPSAGGLTVDFSISVHASVAFTIALGWMSGSVSIMLGFEAEYHKQPQQNAAFNISVFILFTGYVDILSLITVHLQLLLQATYRSLGNGGNELIGTGQVKLTIRICRFIKIKVNKTYTKVIARSGGDGTRALAAVDRPGVITGLPRDKAEPRCGAIASATLATLN
ncbi:MAG TPA: hypothetical protein VJU77_16840 [Chthoniobacterales bacterium]|nr:hypothetical protein [Chthoniobacterales bacterium]